VTATGCISDCAHVAATISTPKVSRNKAQGCLINDPNFLTLAEFSKIMPDSSMRPSTRFLLLTVSIFGLCLNSVKGQGGTNAPQAQVITAQAAPATQPTNFEAELLREETKVIQLYDDKLLRTVHWALGSVFSIAALLVGYGWWTNFRMADKDRQRLKEETLNDANANMVKLRSEIEAALAKAITDVNQNALQLKNELSNMSTSMNAAAEQRTIEFADKITKQLQSYRSEVDESLRTIMMKYLPEMETRLNAVITKNGEERKKELDAQAHEIKQRVMWLTWRVYDNLGNQSAKDEAWSSAITWHLTALEAAVDRKVEWAITQSLTGMQAALSNGGKASKPEKERLAKIENRIPEKLLDQYRTLNGNVQESPDFIPPSAPTRSPTANPPPA
jgi:hypothetical protein